MKIVFVLFQGSENEQKIVFALNNLMPHYLNSGFSKFEIVTDDIQF